MFVNFNILNQLGSPAINSNTFANRPAAGQTGRLFISTDTFEIYRDNGTSWNLIGGSSPTTITGTGVATRVAYFTGAQTIGSSANLYWDATNSRLGIGTATPGARLDVHATGTVGVNTAELNCTSAIGSTYLQFRYQGTANWRLGNTLNGSTAFSFFSIHNSALNLAALTIENATNKKLFTSQQNYTSTSGQAQGAQFNYNLSVDNGVTFFSPNAVHAVNSYLNLSLAGNATAPVGIRQGLEGNSRISFTGAGTLTVTQGSTLRAWSSLSSVYSFNGTAVGTITHLAGLRICFPDNLGAAINVTNNYALVINDQTAGLGTVTYTNRWGIYQEGASDKNYFNGNTLIKSTVDSGQALQVNGTAKATNLVIDEQVAPATPATGTGIIYAKSDNLIYFKNDAGTEYDLTLSQDNLTTIAFQALGSTFKGFLPSNVSCLVSGNVNFTDNQVAFIAYYLPTAQTITGVKFFQSFQGVYTADNYNGVGLYSYSGGTMTLVASSTNDGNIWKGTAQTWQTKAFSSTYNAAAGLYFIAYIYNNSAQTTAPIIGGTTSFSANAAVYDFTNSAKLSSTLNGQNSLPASQAMSGTTTTNQNPALFLY